MPQIHHHFFQRLMRWRFLFIVLFLFILFLAFTLGREFLQTYTIASEIRSLEAQANSLTARNLALSELQTAVQTESFIEREARLKLGMKKPGEEVVVIQTGGQAVSDSGTDPLHLVLNGKETRASLPNPDKWWNYFFNKALYTEL